MGSFPLPVIELKGRRNLKPNREWPRNLNHHRENPQLKRALIGGEETYTHMKQTQRKDSGSEKKIPMNSFLSDI